MPDPGHLPRPSCLLALEQERDWRCAAETCGVSISELIDIVHAVETWHRQPLVKSTDAVFEGFTPQGEHVLALVKELQAGLQALAQCFAASRRSLTTWSPHGAGVTRAARPQGD